MKDDERDETNTGAALEGLGIALGPREAGLLRLGVGAALGQVYCHSFAPLDGLCGTSLFTNQVRPFANDGSGRFNHQAAVSLAHERAHFFGVCSSENHPHCLNGHLANEIPDIMVWNGEPVNEVRPEGMLMKCLTACTPVYDELLTCDNGGLDCVSTYWSSSVDGVEPREVRPRDERLAVQCCEGEAPLSPVTCVTAGIGGVETAAGDLGCPSLMTWPEADQLCRQAQRRLCTVEELEDASPTLCASAGCGSGQARGWTATPRIEAAELVGRYQRLPVEDPFHDVTIVRADGRLMWTNAAAVSWSLGWQDGRLSAGEDSPYGAQDLTVSFERDARGQLTRRVRAVVFLDEAHTRQ